MTTAKTFRQTILVTSLIFRAAIENLGGSRMLEGRIFATS